MPVNFAFKNKDYNTLAPSINYILQIKKYSTYDYVSNTLPDTIQSFNILSDTKEYKNHQCFQTND